MVVTERMTSKELMERVRRSIGLRVQNLAVQVDAESVTLRGRADCYHTKQLAQESLRDMLPVRAIHNAIEVG